MTSNEEETCKGNHVSLQISEGKRKQVIQHIITSYEIFYIHPNLNENLKHNNYLKFCRVK